jgi:hypothetical protein
MFEVILILSFWAFGLWMTLGVLRPFLNKLADQMNSSSGDSNDD